MTRVEVSGDKLTVHVEGIDRMLALRRRLAIPLDHVVSAEAGGTVRDARGLGALATRLPAAVAPRTFHQQAGRRFLAAHDPERTLVIGLYNERYARLVIEVEDPRAVVASIERAVRAA